MVTELQGLIDAVGTELFAQIQALEGWCANAMRTLFCYPVPHLSGLGLSTSAVSAGRHIYLIGDAQPNTFHFPLSVDPVLNASAQQPIPTTPWPHPFLQGGQDYRQAFGFCREHLILQ